MSELTPVHFVVAGILAVGISAACTILKLLTLSGGLAASVIGFVVFGFGGLPFAIPLVGFFLTASLLSRIGRGRKAILNDQYEKTAIRDAGQVLANGAIPAVLALSFSYAANTREIMLLFLAAVASANADTWATEIGGLARSRPRLVTTLRKVNPGTSGAVTWHGLIASLSGAVFITALGWVSWPTRTTQLLWRIDTPEMIAVTWAAFLAACTDSLIGATAQAHFKCAACGTITERSTHCNLAGHLVRGRVRWINNDLVNLASVCAGVAFAWVLLRFFAYPT